MKVTVNYVLSKEAIKAALVATGEPPADRIAAEVDLVPLSPADRAAVLSVREHCRVHYGLAITLGTWRTDHHDLLGAAQREYDHVLSPEEILEEVRRMAADLPAALAAVEASALAAATESLEHDTSLVRQAIAARLPEFPQYPGLQVRTDGLPYEASPAHAAYKFAWAEYKALQPQFKAEKEEREAAEARDEERKAAEAQEEMRAWAAQHGSDRLKRALLYGYKCRRVYLAERAAVEFPGYHVAKESAAWEERRNPSAEALEALTALPEGTGAEIVWLTEDGLGEEPMTPCEAIVIGSYLGKCDLIMVLRG